MRRFKVRAWFKELRQSNLGIARRRSEALKLRR